MKQTIILIFVSLTAYGSTSSAQQPTTWTEPYFYYHYNVPLALPGQKFSANEMLGDQKQFSSYDDQSVQNTLGSHVLLLTTCLRELQTTKSDLVQTHSDVESVKKELNELKVSFLSSLTDVKTTVDNMKKDMNASVAPSSIGRMPQTCDDLQKIGHWKSGLFSVMGNKTVDNVYCDFTKPINDAGFQNVIGHVNVKTSPVYFYAQKSIDFMNINGTVPFDLLRVNVGNAMNTSGIFVAPTPGKYFFALSGINYEPEGRVLLQLKTATVDWSGISEAIGIGQYQALSLQSILQLNTGDQIRLKLTGGILHDNANHYTNFVGQLLEENNF